MKKLELFSTLLKNTSTILYDFDGVLVDSEKFYYLSYKKPFATLGHKLMAEEYWEFWTSLGQGVIGELNRYNLSFSKKTIKWIYEERKKNYSEFVNKGKIKFIPSSYRTIKLFNTMGKQTIIASNSYEKDLKKIFQMNKKSPEIELIGRKEGLRAKPEPDIFLYAAGFLHAEPKSCFVIEDAHKGLFAAKKVGMKCAIIQNEHNKDLTFDDADIIFDSYKEFFELTKKIYETKK